MVEWCATRCNITTQTDANKTILAYGANTKDRSSRHFGACSRLCEHACDVPDTIEHRLPKCAGTTCLPQRLFSAEDQTLLATQPQATKTCAVWGMTLEESQIIPPEDLAWGLWPRAALLAEIRNNARQTNQVQVRFTYASIRYGKHPILQRHACKVTISCLQIPLQAYAIQTAYSRQQWEADALVLACVIQSLTRLPVSVSGFAATLPALYDMIGDKQAANAYLSDLARTAMTHISVEDRPPIEECNVADLGWTPTTEAISSLDQKWTLTTKVARFHQDAFDYYPQAHSISFRGRTYGGF